MEKSKDYNRIKFSPEKLKEAISKWSEKVPDKTKIEVNQRSIELLDESWSYDSDEEFFADFRKEYKRAHFQLRYYEDKLWYILDYVSSMQSVHYQSTTISITAPSRIEIEDVFYVFDNNSAQFQLPEIDKPIEEEMPPTIFIGHGNNSQWKDLKNHLTELHNYKVEAYETGARAGHTIRDILDDMLTKSSIAFLVLTGEDKLEDGKIYARPNVIHETGLFQGRLGFSRAIVLLEEGVNEFSNLNGIQQIRFSKGNIRETFGDIIATIKREFE